MDTACCLFAISHRLILSSDIDCRRAATVKLSLQIPYQLRQFAAAISLLLLYTACYVNWPTLQAVTSVFVTVIPVRKFCQFCQYSLPYPPFVAVSTLPV